MARLVAVVPRRTPPEAGVDRRCGGGSAGRPTWGSGGARASAATGRGRPEGTPRRWMASRAPPEAGAPSAGAVVAWPTDRPDEPCPWGYALVAT